MRSDAIVEAQNVSKVFSVRGSGLLGHALLAAVSNVSFELPRGSTFGVVGESGSGKSTLASMVAGLLPRTGGVLRVNGVDLETLDRRGLRAHRRHVQVVFQDPYSSLAPTSTIRSSLLEPLRAHSISPASRDDEVTRLLGLVNLAPDLADRYPAQLSGGQLQRVGIARALALHPELVVLDEPVSALDVSTKAEIINLLADLKDDFGLSYLFISHDLSTLRVLADQIAVMYLGSIVECGPAEQVYEAPLHPYTQALLAAVPVADPKVQRGRARSVIRGDIPSPLDPPTGCAFHTRCPVVTPQCAVEVPAPRLVEGTTVACHLVDGGTPVALRASAVS